MPVHPSRVAVEAGRRRLRNVVPACGSVTWLAPSASNGNVWSPTVKLNSLGGESEPTTTFRRRSSGGSARRFLRRGTGSRPQPCTHRRSPRPCSCGSLGQARHPAGFQTKRAVSSPDAPLVKLPSATTDPVWSSFTVKVPAAFAGKPRAVDGDAVGRARGRDVRAAAVRRRRRRRRRALRAPRAPRSPFPRRAGSSRVRAALARPRLRTRTAG